MKKAVLACMCAVWAVASPCFAAEECRDERTLDALESDKTVVALNVRAWRYFNGVGVPADRNIARELWKQAADLGSARASMRLGQPWPHADVAEREYKTNLDPISQAAEKNDLLARVVYARAYLSGQIGGAAGARQGMMLAEHAAEQGSVLACVSLAEFFGVPNRNRPADAKMWRDRALLLARKNEKNLGVEDMTVLGVCLLANRENEENIAEAIRWLTASAQLGDPVAMYHLAANYARMGESENAKGDIKPDFALARQWAAAAVRGGYGRANILFAYLQLSGLGGEKDAEYAADLLIRPVDAGYPEARQMLGMMNLTGQGVRINTWRAEKLLTEAAEDGYAPAMWDLVRIYRDGGMGLARDQEKAATWLQRAYEKGHPEAKAAVEAFQKKQTASQPATRAK